MNTLNVSDFKEKNKESISERKKELESSKKSASRNKNCKG